MTQNEAIKLLKSPEIQSNEATAWADLGCGSGLFTHALATLLAPGSHISAVDRQNNFMPKENSNPITTAFMQGDFVKDEMPFSGLDGILMANALHYVKDKKGFLEKCRKYFRKKGRWIIVEYDSTVANPWVPYPLNFEKLKQLFLEAGYKDVIKNGERESVYRGKMYSAIIS